ncbi:hypothetical protein BGW39_008884 [Mortierella sp. 14UC]|nr:hypothetical protein BGW39_008884 [Mortierella sp. 14UC]
MSVASTPHFIFCPVALLPSRRASTYVETESPPPSPHQQQTIGSSQDQHLQHQKQEPEHPSHGQRRFNESRPIQIPMGLLNISSSPDAKSPAARNRCFLPRPMSALPKKQLSSSALSLSTEKSHASFSFPSSSSTASSSAKRISSLFIKRPSRSTFDVSILPAGHRSTPSNLNLDSTHNAEADADSRRRLLTASPPVEDADMDMDMDMDHESRSCTPSPQIPVAVGHTASQPRVPVRVQSLTFNSNHSNVDLRNNSVRTHSSASSSLHRTSFRVNRTEETTNHNNDSNKSANADNLKEDSAIPTRRKTVLKSVMTSVRQAKKRAADILFGSIHKRSKKSKNFKLHEDAEEGSLANKVDVENQDDDYAMSTLSLTSTAVPSPIILPALTDLDRPASSCYARSSSCPAPAATTAAIAASAGLPHPSWSTSPSSDPFACSADNLDHGSTPNFCDLGESASTLPDNSLQTLAAVEAGTDNRFCRSHSKSVVSQKNSQQESSISSDSSRIRHLYRYFGLEDAETEADLKKKREEERENASARFGGVHYQEWIRSKNRITSFMSKCKTGGKKSKTMSLDVERLSSEDAGGNRSDPYLNLDEQELEYLSVDNDVSGSFSSPKKTNKPVTRSINVPSSTSPSPGPSASFEPLFKAGRQPIRSSSCNVAPQYANGRRKTEQELQMPKPMPFRRVSLSPNTFSPPTSSRESTPAPPSVGVSSAKGGQHLVIPSPFEK